jgi:hypothetical protein
MHAHIMVRHAQRQSVRLSTRPRRRQRRQLARRRRQRDLAVLHAAAIDRIFHRKLVLPRQRACSG